MMLSPQSLYNNYSPQQTISSEISKRNTAFATAFEISTLGCIENDCNANSIIPEKFKHFEILWIRKGSGIITIDLHSHVISANMIICILPGQLHFLKTSAGLEGYRISFSPDFLLQAEGQADLSFIDTCYDPGKSTVIFPGGSMQQELNDIVQLLYKEFKNHVLQRSAILKGFFKIFLIHLVQHIKKTAPLNLQERDTVMVRKFMSLIKEHFLTKKMVSDYAAELCVSPNYLNRIVKKVSGHTASYHIQQLIILEAKRQAIHSGLSMKEVAYSLGFNDYAHFSKFFKNNSGMNFTCFKSGLL